uniref:Uncharacterized protein n=1 Tax=Ditylenchus dipsaci TaxID=166011 RepID=A0A915CQW6_9BILA
MAYGGCIYLRAVSENRITSSLMFAKGKVVPVGEKNKAKFTTPRLELHAITLTARLTKYIEGLLQEPITKIQLWTDAECVKKWLCSAELLDRFVQNRVESTLLTMYLQQTSIGCLVFPLLSAETNNINVKQEWECFEKSKQVTVYVLRFVRKTRKKSHESKLFEQLSKIQSLAWLTAAEVHLAELVLV